MKICNLPVIFLVVALVAGAIPISQAQPFVFDDPAPLNANAASDVGSDTYPAVTTDGSGNWVAVWSSKDRLNSTLNGSKNIFVAHSTDNGATWSAPAVLIPAVTKYSGNHYHPQVATDGAGVWIAVWETTGRVSSTYLGSDGEIVFSRSVDNGATWSDPETINDDADVDPRGDEYPQVATDKAGNWVVVWSGGEWATETDVLTAYSTDNGLTWSDFSSLNTNADSDSAYDQYPQVTTDCNGHWVTVWYSKTKLNGEIQSDNDILTARSTDNGATWTDPATLNDYAAIDHSFDADPHVTTDCAGVWVAVWTSGYFDRDYIGEDRILHRSILFSRSLDNGATWSEAAAVDADAIGDLSNDDDPMVVTDGLGNWVTVWASWYSTSVDPYYDGDILAARSFDNGATWVTSVSLHEHDSDASLQNRDPQVAMDCDGNCIAVWSSDDDLGGTIDDDYDILSVNSSSAAVLHNASHGWRWYE